MGEMFTVRSSKVSEFIYLFSGGVKLTCQRAVCHSYTPYATDLFLLENKSNSEVTKRIQRNAIHVYTRALVQWSILNRKYFGKATNLKRKQLVYRLLVYRSLPVSSLEICLLTP